MTDFVVRYFFHQHNLTKNFITLKASDNPVMKLGGTRLRKYTCIEYTCLVIPTRARVTSVLTIEKTVDFYTELMDEHSRFTELINRFKGGLCAWHSHKVYKLCSSRMHPNNKIMPDVRCL